MKKLWILIAFVLILAGCQKAPSHQRGEALYEDEKYEAAAEVYRQLVEDDEEDYDAWLGLSDALLASELFEDAEAVLSDLMTLLLDSKSDRLEQKQYLIGEISDRVSIIMKETGDIGAWYKDLMPEAISLDMFEFTEVTVGSKIVLDVDTDVAVYYNFSGNSVSTNDIKYMDGIDFVQAGNYTLSVAAISDLGIVGQESRAFITVLTPEDLIDMPRINYESGTYEGPVTVRFIGYDSQLQDVYFTLDGSAPEFGTYYDADSGIVLYAGTYELIGKVYDWQLDAFSEAIQVTLEVTGAESEGEVVEDKTIRIAVLTENEDISVEVMWAIDGFAIMADAPIETLMYQDIDALLRDLSMGLDIDAIYTNNQHTVELYNYIGDVTYIADITEDYSYYDSVVESVYFWDAYYCLPVTAKPTQLLYYNYSELIGYYNDGLTYEDFIFEMDVDAFSSGLTLREPTDPYTFLAIYYGLGGTVANELGYVSLDEDVLVETLVYYQFLVSQGYLNPEADMQTWEDLIYEGDGDFVVAAALDYHGEDFSISYEPTTGIPLNQTEMAVYPLSVDGLFIAYDVTMNASGFKAGIIQSLYEYLATDNEHNNYMINTSLSLPAMSNVVTQRLYDGILELDVYESLIETAPPLSLDLFQLFDYADIEAVLYDVMKGLVSAEDGADLMMTMIEDAYLE